MIFVLSYKRMDKLGVIIIKNIIDLFCRLTYDKSIKIVFEETQNMNNTTRFISLMCI
jgi:hypothetical protein